MYERLRVRLKFGKRSQLFRSKHGCFTLRQHAMGAFVGRLNLLRHRILGLRKANVIDRKSERRYRQHKDSNGVEPSFLRRHITARRLSRYEAGPRPFQQRQVLGRQRRGD
ncbi:MAG: hypothetical protein DI603_22285 [Roseateles depolymerans]|uniref:Uncharacterized protein n=1 Tax=Roseateles depolymerans TaxID=76731 RepID=A0A2W5D9R0_9BURK|nr:MAG: hypothetical protein DI603_22285 [Roseateles depolymerans]